MISSLSNLLNKPVVSFCLGAAAVISYFRFFNGNGIESKDECIIEVDGYIAIVSDIINTSLRGVIDTLVYPSDPLVPKKLASALNAMDVNIKVKPRWDVMEDEKTLYILRDLSGLCKKDVTEYVEFPSGDNCFFDYRMSVFGSARIYRIKQYPSAILIIKHLGWSSMVAEPSYDYPWYTVNIDLPGRLYKTRNVSMDVKDEILKISIPKEKGKRWINKITVDAKLYCDVPY